MEQQVVRGGIARLAWLAAGWLSVGVGGLGVVVPGLPTTVFFIMAAACFSRSSPRFERWVLDLPRIGPMVSDYRDGLGMPRRAKRLAIGTIVVVSLLSALVTADAPLVRVAILALAAIGSAYVMWRVPTRERVLARRARRPARSGHHRVTRAWPGAVRVISRR